MKEFNFTKMVAAGNDFVIVDMRCAPCAMRIAQEPIKKICDRRYGIGADGLLLMEDSKKADFRMRIFNPDGGEAEMCGNGIRCAALYYKEYRVPLDFARGRQSTPRLRSGQAEYRKFKIETKAGMLEAEVKGGNVKIKMAEPKDLKLNLEITVNCKPFTAHFINTGVPHVVMFVKNLEAVPVEEWGRQIRYDKSFSPQGTNANFVKVLAKNRISVRTYERGVEAETLACGTGAVASSIITAIRNPQSAIRNKNAINIYTKSGQMLKVYFDHMAEKITNVYLEGPARIVYEGRMKL